MPIGNALAVIRASGARWLTGIFKTLIGKVYDKIGVPPGGTVAISLAYKNKVDGIIDINSSSKLGYPVGMAVDADDNVYVCDRINNSIRKISTTGEVITILKLSFVPSEVSLDTGNNLYILSTNKKIYKYNTSGVLVYIVSTTNGFSSICIDGSNKLYAREFATFKINIYNTSTGIISSSITYGSNNDGVGNSFLKYYDGYIYYVSDGKFKKLNTSTSSIINLNTTTFTNLVYDLVKFNGLDTFLIFSDSSVYYSTLKDGVFSGSTILSNVNLYSLDDTFIEKSKITKDASRLVIDSKNNIYVSSALDKIIYKISLKTRKTQTIAGSFGVTGNTDSSAPLGLLSHCIDIKVDANDIIYFTEDTKRLRKISNGIVSTIFDNTNYSSAYNDNDGELNDNHTLIYSPNNLVINPINQCLYFSSDIYLKTLTLNKELSTYAGKFGSSGTYTATTTSESRLDKIFGKIISMCCKNNGDFYILSSPQKGFKISGDVTTFIPSLSSGINGFYNGYQNLIYTVNSTSNRGSVITVYDTSISSSIKIIGTIPPTPSLPSGYTYSSGSDGYTNGTNTVAQFSYGISGIVYNSLGDIYVADQYNYAIRKIDKTTNVVTTFAGGLPIDGIYTWHGVDTTMGPLYKKGQMGDVDATGTNARFGIIYCMCIDNLNNIYIIDSNQKLKKITSTGVVTTLANISFKTRNATTIDVVDMGGMVKVDDSFYISCTYNHTIWKYDLDTNIFEKFCGMIDWSGNKDGIGVSPQITPKLLCIDKSNNDLYIYCDDYKIKKLKNQTLTTVITGLSSVYGMAIDSNKNIFYHGYDKKMRKIEPNGTTTIFGTSLQSTIYHPINNLDIDSYDNLYLVDNYKIKKIEPNGTQSNPSTISDPITALAVDLNGAIYSTNKNIIYRTDLTSITQCGKSSINSYGYLDSILSKSTIMGPTCMSCRPNGSLLFGDNTVIREIIP